MPALPSKRIRRKGATPILKVNQEDVWQRTLDIMGLEPLNARGKGNMAVQGDDGAVATPSHAQGSQSGERKPLNISDLPLETKKDIFKHVSTIFLEILAEDAPAGNSPISDHAVYLRPPRPTLLPFPSSRSTSEILLQSSCIGTSISSSQTRMIHSTIAP